MLTESDDPPDAAGSPPRPVLAQRATAQAAVIELADARDFAHKVDRQALRSKRHGEVQAALVLEVRFPTAEADALRLQLLAECARRIRSRVRSTDAVGQWQLTHFGVLLPRCNAEQAEAVLARLTQFVSGHYRLRTQLLDVELLGRVMGRAGTSPSTVILP